MATYKDRQAENVARLDRSARLAPGSLRQHLGWGTVRRDNDWYQDRLVLHEPMRWSDWLTMREENVFVEVILPDDTRIPVEEVTPDLPGFCRDSAVARFPKRTIATSCPKARTLMMAHRETGNIIYQPRPCGKRRCDWCFEEVICPRVIDHLASLCPSTCHATNTALSRWTAERTWLRRHAIDFAPLPMADGSLAVLTSESTRSSVEVDRDRWLLENLPRMSRNGSRRLRFSAEWGGLWRVAKESKWEVLHGDPERIKGTRLPEPWSEEWYLTLAERGIRCLSMPDDIRRRFFDPDDTTWLVESEKWLRAG